MTKEQLKENRGKKSQNVNFEVVVNSGGKSKSIYAEDAYIAVANIDEFRPPKDISI